MYSAYSLDIVLRNMVGMEQEPVAVHCPRTVFHKDITNIRIKTDTDKAVWVSWHIRSTDKIRIHSTDRTRATTTTISEY